MQTNATAGHDAAARLAVMERGTDGGTAAALFDALPVATIEGMRGMWRGGGLPTGHPLDGLLERYGWYGKRFTTADDVDPLVFARGGGTIDVDPRFVPMGLVTRRAAWFHHAAMARLFRWTAPMMATRKPRARLRMTQHRGVMTATMIYDALPVMDVFRTVDAETRLGWMELRGMAPFFFVLRREAAR